MRILVCISSVPDTTSKITFNNDHTELNSNGLQYIINPYDEIALTRAIELTQGGNGAVTVIHVGKETSDPIIRKALAFGADDAVRIDAHARDAWFVAHQIASYIKDNSFDLILTGRESIDYNGAQVAALLGELLNMPSVSIAKKIEINDNQANIDREIEGGKETLTASLPVVVGTAEGVAEPMIPNLRGIMGARTKPLQVIAPIEVSELATINNYESPQARGTVKLVEQVDQLVDLLHTQAKVI